MNTISNFSFIALTYNHAQFILEHLESIKYLVLKYGKGIEIDLIVADDASKDRTVELIKSWIKFNKTLFRKITIQTNEINIGTCKNFTRSLTALETAYCKITGGDDVYSFENLFLESSKIDSNEIVSGLPLNLIAGEIKPTKFELFNHFASNQIYKYSHFTKRLKRINFFNAPNIVYSTSVLKNQTVINFIERFSVTEDYPLQIKMAEIFSPTRFYQVDKTFVYYRRTSNSTYIIKNLAFSKDKFEIYKYLIQSRQSYLDKILISNRFFCYKLSSKVIKTMLNLNYYLYGIQILINIKSIIGKYQSFDPEIKKHQKHFDLISQNAKEFTRRVS